MNLMQIAKDFTNMYKYCPLVIRFEGCESLLLGFDDKKQQYICSNTWFEISSDVETFTFATVEEMLEFVKQYETRAIREVSVSGHDCATVIYTAAVGH